MTLPDERYRAVMWAERFLKDLAHNSILRQFPSQWDMDRASNGAPDVFQPRMEDLHRFLLKGKEVKDENRS